MHRQEEGLRRDNFVEGLENYFQELHVFFLLFFDFFKNGLYFQKTMKLPESFFQEGNTICHLGRKMCFGAGLIQQGPKLEKFIYLGFVTVSLKVAVLIPASRPFSSSLKGQLNKACLPSIGFPKIIIFCQRHLKITNGWTKNAVKVSINFPGNVAVKAAPCIWE